MQESSEIAGFSRTDHSDVAVSGGAKRGIQLPLRTVTPLVRYRATRPRAMKHALPFALPLFCQIACSAGATPPMQPTQSSKPDTPCTTDDRKISIATIKPREQTDDSSALVFRIESFDPSGPARQIRYRLRNVSDEMLWVNARMSDAWGSGEVLIRVAPSSSGKPLDLDCRVHSGPAQYVMLAP